VRLIYFLLLSLICGLQARQIETFYGTLEVEEPVLLDLIDSAPFQRLRAIHQYGVAYFTTHREEFTRYDHCLGVFALLRIKGFSLKEQIAGLLHDVSHTVFSHVGDWIFGKEHQDKDYQDTIHLAFLKSSGIETLLQRHGFEAEQVLPELFAALECRRPDLCADRIDYNIQGAYLRGFITYVEALALVESMQFVNGIWISTQQDLLTKLARFPLFMTLDCWSSPTNEVSSRWLAEAILKGVSLGIFSDEELHFGTDLAVWNTLLNTTDTFIQERMQKVLHAENYYTLVDPAQTDQSVKVKFRGIDPWIQTTQGVVRLTTLDAQFRAEYHAVKDKTEKGWAIQVIEPSEAIE